MVQMSNKRKNKIYGNCQIYSKAGNLITLCLEDRANWYLDRGLAVKKTESPLSIQLLFEVKSEGNVGDKYYLSAKKNICVKCGTENLDALTKHHIVPQMYRKFLPEHIKSRNSFDVCPMCFDDHEKYERYADELKKQLAEKYNAPLAGICIENENQSKQTKAKRCATALLLHKDKMPLEKREQMLSLLKECLGKVEITDEDIKQAIEILPHSKKAIKSHGEIVMSQITDYQAFVEMWREHFLKHVQPEFMPEHWDSKRSIIRN